MNKLYKTFTYAQDYLGKFLKKLTDFLDQIY